jgi:serine phosphatase RsbU (regulator of sigma subunit)
MNHSTFGSVLYSIEKELNELQETLQLAVHEVGKAFRRGSLPEIGKRINAPPMIDPVRFKKILVQILKILIIIELISAFRAGLNDRQWGRFGFDLLVAGILYAMWERITTIIRSRKGELLRRMENSSQEVKLWDALIFSLLWTDEIYADIPADRRRLVVTSYTLIALGLVAAFVQIGPGLMPLVVTGALILGAVNLVSWVVSRERGARETLQTELKLAHDVQTSLMPREDPQVEGFDIAGLSVPAKEVGGDLFDYCWLGADRARFAISVFDVSGKGMQAALAAVFTSGAYAGEVRQSASPAEILTRLGRSVFSHSRRGHFVAFLLAALDVRAKTLIFANAGQSKPLLKSGADVQWLESIGVHFPLGMQEEIVFEERTVNLRSGDVLFLFTDGFTDAMNVQEDMFGYERLEQLVTRPDFEGLSASSLLEKITNEIKAHVAAAPQHDDMTMVVVKAL